MRPFRPPPSLWTQLVEAATLPPCHLASLQKKNEKWIGVQARGGVKGDNNPRFGKPRAEGAGRTSQKSKFLITKLIKQLLSNLWVQLQDALYIRWTAIKNYFNNNQQKLHKGRYIFKKIAKLMESKAHLTKEGLEEIRMIKSGMNSLRFNTRWEKSK
jgi:hypothetical protein